MTLKMLAEEKTARGLKNEEENINMKNQISQMEEKVEKLEYQN